MIHGRQIIQGDTIEEFWALNDISFDVFSGEVVGIVGGNGAGKSTLLKILSRITEPTRGSVTLRGRVASLLEVGTGFHPELSGRENIFLNGAILGMSRAEIKRKFDEIVAFAEVEKFLDTPVKRYSSGMYVRLAFSVAAHLEPEILVVDEVLAVGDAQFQKKCLGKMQDVSQREGRTVLFVSHNMAAVKSLCTRAICLEKGHIVADGDTDAVLRRYLHMEDGEEFDGQIPHSRPRQYGTGELFFRYIQNFGNDARAASTFESGTPLNLRIGYEVTQTIEAFRIEVGILDIHGNQITQSYYPSHNQSFLSQSAGEFELGAEIKCNLAPGRYSILLGAHKSDGTTIDWVESAMAIDVTNAHPTSNFYNPWPLRGFFVPDNKWTSPLKLNRD